VKPIRLLFAGIFRRSRMEQEMAEELASHLQNRTDDLVRSGCSPQEAARRARLEFGAMEGYKESCREARGLAWFDELCGNLRFTLRGMRGSPGYFMAAALSLAIGIGANLCAFTTVNAILLHPFPFPQLDRVMILGEANGKAGGERNPIAPGNFFDWKENNQSFASLAAFRDWDALLTGTGEPERVRAARVSAEFFTALGMPPAQGRAFAAEECIPGSDGVVVVSSAFQKSHLIVPGQTISLDGRPHTVIGVMPDEFDFPLATSVWAPLAFGPQNKARRDVADLSMIGRLRAGVTVERARSEMAAIAAALARRYPQTNEGRSAAVQPLTVIDEVSDRFVLILLCASGFVLMLACANVGNLQLARFTARQKEMGLRTALGAGSMRLVRQLLTESVVMSTAGGLVGLAVGYWELVIIKSTIPTQALQWVAGLRHLDIDPMVLAFGVAISIAAGALCSVPMIYQLLRQRRGAGLSETLKESGRGAVSSRAGNRARTVLVAGEIALALVLLVGAGLMVRTFERMLAVNAGIDPKGILTLEVTPSPNAYREGAQRAQFYERALREMGTLSGVESAGLSGGVNAPQWEIEGRETPRPGEPRPFAQSVSPRYFAAMHLPVVDGRAIGEQDGPEAPRVAVLSQAVARYYWHDASPVGQRVRIGGPSAPWLIVAGVSGDVRDWFGGEAVPLLYVSYRQDPPDAVRFALRTLHDPMQSAGAARQAIRRVDANQAIYNVKSMEQVLDEETSGVKSAAMMMSIDAAIALLLALMGSYSVASFFVAQRTQEIGVRVALGASPRSIVRMVLAQTARTSAFGLAPGLAVAVLMSAALSKVLFHAVSVEPLTFVALTVMLAGSALLAAYLPARRAARVDPAITLRGE
jgi:predicted permease